MKNNISNNRLYFLDLIRVAIVMLILLFHINIHFSWQVGVKLIDNFFHQGAFAMSAFFMLSGFVLFYLYKNLNINDWDSLKNFYKKRFVRIYPLYIASILLSYFLFFFKADIPIVMWIMQLIPLQAFFPQTFPVFLNGGMWFVSVIFFLYLCFPFFAHILKNTKANLIGVFIIIYCICNYFMIVNTYYPEPITSLYVSPIVRSFEFFLGMLTAKYVLTTNHKELSCSVKNAIVCILNIALILLVGGLAHSKYTNNVRFETLYLNFDIFFLPIFAIILYFGSKINTGFLYKLSSLKITQYLSKVSYAFYIAQFFSINIFKNYFSTITNNWSIFFIVVGLNFLIAIILYEGIEKPLNNILSKTQNPQLPRGGVIFNYNLSYRFA